jgi:hypothetical protein
VGVYFLFLQAINPSLIISSSRESAMVLSTPAINFGLSQRLIGLDEAVENIADGGRHGWCPSKWSDENDIRR